MLLEGDGTCKLSPEEFDHLLGRAERARDLLAGGAALLREPQPNIATAADTLAVARNVVGAIVGELEDVQARAFEQRRERERLHAQAAKHIGHAGR